MIAADDDRRLQRSGAHHFVEREPGAIALAEADPAYARRKSLECNTLARHVEPAVERCILGEELLHLAVGLVDVLGVAGERHPAKRPLTSAEERPNIGRDETGKVECVGDAFFPRHLPDVVAVVDCGNAHAQEAQHGIDVFHDRGSRGGFETFGIGFLRLAPPWKRPPRRQVAVHEIVC